MVVRKIFASVLGIELLLMNWYDEQEIAMKVKGVIRKYENPSFRATWEDWILAESLRR